MEVRDATNLPIIVEDSLPALVKNLCFEAMPDLVANKSVVYRYFSYHGYLRLDPEGSLILLSGDGNPTIRVDRSSFLRAFYACGLRFMQLLRQVQGDPPHPNTAQLIAFLEQYQVVGQTALAELAA